MFDSSIFVLSGDPGTIRSSARKWSAFSAAASTASAGIRRVDSGDFQGDEAETYRGRLDQDLPPHLDTTSEAWSMVAAALVEYSNTLEGLQSQLAGLSAKADRQQDHLTQASEKHADAVTADAHHAAAADATKAASKPGETMPADTYRSQTAGAATQVESAGQDLQATIDDANRLHTNHNTAVERCVTRINQAKGLRFEEPPGFLGRLKNSVSGWIKDHADLFKGISSVLKQISNIAGILAMIPVLAPVMGPIAAVSGAGAVAIDATVYLATGEGSLTDILMDGASMLPFGKGLAIVKDARTTAKAAKQAKNTAEVVAESKAVSTVSTDAAAAKSLGTEAKATDSVAETKAGNGSGRAADQPTNAAETSTPVENHCTTGDPIDVVTGKMLMVQTDLSLPGVLPLVLRRVHLSSYRWGGLFGPTWASTLDQRVEIGDDDGACFVAEDGVVLYFPDAGDLVGSTYAEPIEGIQRWRLRRSADRGWTVEDPETGLIRRFGPPDADNRCVITELTDRQGNWIRFAYGASGVVNQLEHSGGYRVGIRSSAGRVTGLVVLDGSEEQLVASFGYQDGNLIRVNNSDGDPLTFDCDESGRIIGWTDRNQIWYRYEYDEDGRCVRTSGRGRVLSYGFSYLPGRTLVTDSLGAIFTYEYNAARQVTKVIDPLGNVTASVWDRFDRLLLRTDPMGRTTQYEYDPHGRLIEVIRPDGARECLQRNTFGRPMQITDAAGAAWTREYDDAGNLQAHIDALGQRTDYERDATGAVSAVIDPDGHRTTVTGNAAGLPTTVIDPLGHATTFEYDYCGRLVASTDPLGATTRLGWTVEGRLAYRIGPDGAREEWTWDGEGNLTSDRSPTGAITVVENGVFDLPVVRVDPDGGEMRFGYDTELRLTSVQNAEGRRWAYDYDPAGRLIQESDFNGSTQQYGYDAAGRLVTVVNGVGQEIFLGYDDADRLVRRLSAEGECTFGYDPVGRLLAAVSPDAVVHLDRDRAGRVIRETVNGRSVNLGLDAMGRRVSRITPDGMRTDWMFDPAGRPSSLRTVGQQVDFEFDAAGREVGRAFSGGARLEQGYDVADRLISQILTAAQPTAPIRDRAVVTARAFRYRPDDALVEMSDSRGGGVRRFELDSMTRVVQVSAADWTESYAYDRAGRISGSEPAADREYSGTLLSPDPPLC